jgi:predicted MFS family arabinose efflux permease
MSLVHKETVVRPQSLWLLVVAGGLCLFIAMGVGRFAYTPILPWMQEETHFTNAVAGYLASSNYFGYLLGAVLAGSVAWIRQRRLTTLRVSLTLSVLTTGIMAATLSTWAWLVFRAISGVASGLVFVLVSSIVLDSLAKYNRPRLSGILYGGVGLGIATSGWIVPILDKSFGWQGTWIGLMLLTIVLGIVSVVWIKDERGQPEQQGVRPQAHGSAPKGKGYFHWLTVAYGCEGLGYIITGTFLVAMATKMPALHGFASHCWVLVGLAALPSCIVWTYVAHRWGEIPTLVAAYLLQAVGVILTVIIPTAVGVYLGSILFGGTFMGITTLGTMLGRKLRPTDSSKAIGLMTGIYGIGQIVGSGGAGLLASYSGGFEIPTLVASGIIVVGAVILIVGRFIFSGNQENIEQGMTG